MKKMTKEQTERFDRLWNRTINWFQDEGMCNGLFEEFGQELGYLSTYVSLGGDALELFYCSSIYDASGIGVITLDSKAKTKFKAVVQYLMDHSIDDHETIKKIESLIR